jgi:hypothetical protein
LEALRVDMPRLSIRFFKPRVTGAEQKNAQDRTK